MSTFVGHSDLHALHDRHRSSERLTYSLFHVVGHDLALEHLEQHVRPAARAVLLLERRHVARAHRAVVVLAALANADAAERRLRERSVVVRELEVRAGILGLVVGAETQVLRGRVRVDQLARVHLVVRVPDRLELAECPHQLGAEHLRQQRAARLSIAVLARDRAAVADHEIRRPLDELAVRPDAGFAPQVEADLHVNAAVPEVPVVDGLIAVLVQQRAEIAQIAAQMCGRDCRIVPPFPPRRRPGAEMAARGPASRILQTAFASVLV